MNLLDGKIDDEPSKPTFTDEQVDAIYKAYPRKESPAPAKVEIRKSLIEIATGTGKSKGHKPRHDAFDVLLERVQIYARLAAWKKKTKEGKNIHLYPERWFKRACYYDDPDCWRNPSGDNGDGH